MKQGIHKNLRACGLAARRLFAMFVLTVFVVCAFPLAAFAAEDAALLELAVCDMDADGEITASDARLLLRASAHLEILTPTAAAVGAKVKLFGDLDADKEVTASDARTLLRISAKLETLSEALLAKLVGEADPKPDPDLDPVDLPSRTLLTPNENHGLGSARMCVVAVDGVEAMPTTLSDEKSNPTYSPLMNGTVDYVDKVGFVDSREYYVLNSGRKIPRKTSDGKTTYVTLLQNGYVMPKNAIKAMTAVVGARSTDVYFQTDWLVPLNVSYQQQNYFTGYDGRPWNLRSFTAEYMDVQFYHTGSATGTVNFDANSVISRAQWLSTSGSTATLRLFFREAGGFYGYDLSVTDSGYIKLSLKQKSLSLAGKVVMLDPGHGGYDPGAVSIIDNVTGEKHINLSIAQEAAKVLRARGARVVLSREGDTEPSLLDRTALARKENADVFVSIHLDSAVSSAYGTSVYYFTPYAVPFAQTLQDSLVAAYKTKVYANDATRAANVNRGIKFYPFHVARLEICPSVLIEVGFLSNATELAALKSSTNQRVFGTAIADGITKFLGGA